jgi:hypothetical protein
MCQNRPYSLGGIEVAMSILLPVREQIALSDQPRDILFFSGKGFRPGKRLRRLKVPDVRLFAQQFGNDSNVQA